MNRTELIAAMSEKAGISKKDAEAALKAFTDTVCEQIKEGNKVQIVGFATFEKKTRAARNGRNLQTGETVRYEQKDVATCKMSKSIL